jgi:peptidoglycan/LPS O-acetylase OafA/YrhL
LQQKFLGQENQQSLRHFVAHWTLIAALGAATVLVGGILAYRAYSKDRGSLQATAGFLLVTGFACLGVAVYLIGGSPF